jgi:superfamily II DNA or RNA helicase
MSEQSSGAVPRLPPIKDARRGQIRIWEAIAESACTRINVQLPTGYGKTLSYCRGFAILQAQQRADHLLIIFPNDTQLEQFKANAPGGDLRIAGVQGSREVVDIRFYQQAALRRQQAGARIFVVTIQALIQNRARLVTEGLMARGRWMIVIDEYHHYGRELPWGATIQALPHAFRFACSATPGRPHDDNVLGQPDVIVTYREAAQEKAVMRLRGHAYVYKLDAIREDGDVESYTPLELYALAGGSAPEQVEGIRIERGMRWSPKYISPLIQYPLGRILRDRATTGLPLQALVGAMCVSHAKLMCQQIQAMFPELRTDWVGTGQDGRSDEANGTVLAAFSPPKDALGDRPWPSLDVLVQVGLFGEGGDSPWIAEIISARTPAITNRELQFFGRASRVIPKEYAGRHEILAHINFDSSSEFALRGYLGAALMDAMDGVAPRPDPDDDDPASRNGYLMLPEEPEVAVIDVTLLRIDRGDPDIEHLAVALTEAEGRRYDPTKPEDLDHIIRFLHHVRARQAAQFNQEASVARLSQQVEEAVSVCVANAIRRLMARDQRPERTLAGDLKRRINIRKAKELGQKTLDLQVLHRHWSWTVALNTAIIKTGLPAWLT